MLDDLRYIHEHDPSDALGVAEKQWQQLTKTYSPQLVARPISNVVVAGMGGSGWPMKYLLTWPSVDVPFTLVQTYDIPKFVDDKTLFVASSYSGNTEETLSALDEADKTGALIVVLTTGGQLLERAQAKGYALYQIPTGTQPRMSTFYFLAAMVHLLEALQLTQRGSLEELTQVADWLKDQIASWLPIVPTSKNAAKQLSLEILGKSAVIYGGPLLAPAAQKWKICINENAKHVAWWNQFPEFSHNEFIGWSGQPVDKPYCVIELRSNLEHPRVQKRFEVTERMLSGKRPTPHIVKPEGQTVLQQLLWTSILGDYTSIYLALLDNVDPTPVELVEKFKKALDE